MQDIICYVCAKKIKDGDGQYLCKDTWRHHDCCPGSTKWLRSSIGKKSPFHETLMNRDQDRNLTPEEKEVKRDKKSEAIKSKISQMFVKKT